MYSIITTKDWIKDIHKAIGEEPIVYEQVGSFGGDIGTILQAASRVNTDILILDLDTGHKYELIQGIGIFQKAQPHARILVLAVDRKAGEPEISALEDFGVRNIIYFDFVEGHILVNLLTKQIKSQGEEQDKWKKTKPKAKSKDKKKEKANSTSDHPWKKRLKAFFGKAEDRITRWMDEDVPRKDRPIWSERVSEALIDPVQIEERAVTGSSFAFESQSEKWDEEPEKTIDPLLLDPSSGCYHRGFLDQKLAEVEQEYIRHAKIFSIILLDLDHFKSINDTYGHQVGNQLLGQFGQFLMEQARRGIIAARYGGEAFMLVLPEAPLEIAVDIAERLRIQWAKVRLSAAGLDKPIYTTLSGGVAERNGQVLDVKELLAIADRALHQAKEQGRNRVLPKKEQKLESGAEIPQKAYGLHTIMDYLQPPRVIGVWNANGDQKAKVALDLAMRFKNQDKQVVLLEYDTVNPVLDELCKVPCPPLSKCKDKNYWEIGAGILTFGEQATVEALFNVIHCYAWGIDYLPAGNPLGQDQPVPLDSAGFGQLIEGARDSFEKVIIDIPTDLNSPPAQGAFRKSEIIIVPISRLTDASNKQVERLRRLGISMIELEV